MPYPLPVLTQTARERLLYLFTYFLAKRRQFNFLPQETKTAEAEVSFM